MTDWPPRDPAAEPPPEPEPASEEAAAAEQLHAAPPPPETTTEPAPLWQSPPREPVEPVEPVESVEPVEPVQEPEEPNQNLSEWSEAPTTTTDPTDWFDPPAVEAVTEAATNVSVPEHLHPPSLGGIGASAYYASPAKAMDEVAFSLDSLDADQRAELLRRLTEANLACRLAEQTLYGRIDDASAIEAFLADLVGSEDIEEVIEDADDEEDEIVFDLAALSVEQRRHLGMRLTGAGISYIWEVGTDLVVSVADAPVIETYIEEVRNPEGFGDDEIASFSEDSDVDDEEIYAAMSHLYVAADKLMQKPGDEPTAGAFYLAADDVEGLPAPFGFDPRVWSQVLDLTTSITNALDAQSDLDTIGAEARTLREILVNYV